MGNKITKQELMAKFEKQMAQLPQKMADYMGDYVHIYNLRNRVELSDYDSNIVKSVLELSKLGLKEAYLREIPNVIKTLEPEIEKLIQERDEATATSPKVPSTKPVGKSKK